MFLFVAVPEDVGEESGDSWEGAFSKMQRYTENKIGDLETSMTKQLTKMQEMVEIMDKRDTVTDKNLNKMLSGQHTQNQKRFERQSELLEQN